MSPDVPGRTWDPTSTRKDEETPVSPGCTRSYLGPDLVRVEVEKVESVTPRSTVLPDWSPGRSKETRSLLSGPG